MTNKRHTFNGDSEPGATIESNRWRVVAVDSKDDRSTRCAVESSKAVCQQHSTKSSATNFPGNTEVNKFDCLAVMCAIKQKHTFRTSIDA